MTGTGRPLFARQQKLGAEVVKNDAFGRDLLDYRAFGKAGILPVANHVDEHEAVRRCVAVDVNIEMQLSDLHFAGHT